MFAVPSSAGGGAMVSYTGFSMAWATPDTVATIIGLVTPVLVWAIPNKKVA